MVRLIVEKKPRKKKRKVTKKRREFSKIIFICIAILAFGVAVTSVAATFILQDTTPLTYLIPAVFAELATGTAFYYLKAKKENEIKLRLLYGKQIMDDVADVESVAVVGNENPEEIQEESEK